LEKKRKASIPSHYNRQPRIKTSLRRWKGKKKKSENDTSYGAIGSGWKITSASHSMRIVECKLSKPCPGQCETSGYGQVFDISLALRGTIALFVPPSVFYLMVRSAEDGVRVVMCPKSLPKLKLTTLVLSLDISKVYGITRLDSLEADGGKLKKRDCMGWVYSWMGWL